MIFYWLKGRKRWPKKGTIHDVLEEVVANFTRTVCGCTLYFGGPCNRAFSTEHLTSIHSQCQELDHSFLDLVLLGQVMATNSRSSLIQQSHQKSTLRKKRRMSYYLQGIQICRTTFLFLHGIGKRRLDILWKWWTYLKDTWEL